MNIKGLKRLQRTNEWVNYNKKNVINLGTMRATSYGWWPYMKYINYKLVFNNGYYSNSTTKHQNQCLRLLRESGINIDYILYSSSHLDDLPGIRAEYRSEVKQLIRAIKKPRSRKTTNAERRERIKHLLGEIKIINYLIEQDKIRY